jgi:hypothetical protein
MEIGLAAGNRLPVTAWDNSKESWPNGSNIQCWNKIGLHPFQTLGPGRSTLYGTALPQPPVQHSNRSNR